MVIILTLNTIAHTVGAILVGVQAKIAYATLNVDNTYSLFGLQVTEESLIGFVSAIMTILVLILSEIIPKTIGARYWDKLARITTVTLMSIIPIFKITGVLWLLKFFSNIAGKSERKSIFKREDISTLAEIAEEQGVIKEKDSDFIKNIVKLQNVKLREIMTPSSVIKSADMDSTIEDFYSKNSEHFNNIILIKVNNSLKKLLLLFFLIFLYKYINKSKIEIWEPRPNWLNSIFNKGFINFIKFFNNKKINYYGDGFLSLCTDKKPFWLIKDKENSNKYKINKFSNFFYFYDLELEVLD